MLLLLVRLCGVVFVCGWGRGLCVGVVDGVGWWIV